MPRLVKVEMEYFLALEFVSVGSPFHAGPAVKVEMFLVFSVSQVKY